MDFYGCQGRKKVIENLGKEIEERDVGAPIFSNPEYQCFPLSRENFRSIGRTELNGKAAYIDEGNQELIGVPNFSSPNPSRVLQHFSKSGD